MLIKCNFNFDMLVLIFIFENKRSNVSSVNSIKKLESQKKLL